MTPINIRIPNFYTILEMYCPTSGTFFTPVDELEIALHEMWEVSNLPMDSKPYEKYFPYAEEFAQMEKDEPAMNKAYRELMCHFKFASISTLVAGMKTA